jgi:hypothetical protein
MLSNNKNKHISFAADVQADSTSRNLADVTTAALKSPETLQKSSTVWAKLSSPETVESSAFALLQTATMPGVKGAYRLVKGDDESGTVIADVILDTAKSFASGYATNSLGTGIGTAASKLGLGGITSWNVHMAVAASIMQSGKSFVRFLKQEIDTEEMLEEVNRTVIAGTASFYYGSLGQTMIPVPVLGAFIGSTVGYFTGNILYQSGLFCLGETVADKRSQARRRQIEELCLHAIPLMQRHREELQRLISRYFTEQTELFSSAFNDMDVAFAACDPESYLKQLEIICNAFDTGLPFKSFLEFDAFMHDESKTFML